jgi:hypothetical protein
MQLRPTPHRRRPDGNSKCVMGHAGDYRVPARRASPNKLGRVKGGCTTASDERRDQSTVLGAGPRANWKCVEKSAVLLVASGL